jgi:hypothetical protein
MYSSRPREKFNPTPTAPAVISSTSFGINAITGTKKDIVTDIAGNIIALDNQKFRERTTKENTIRSGIGLIGSTVGLVNPVAGTVIGLGMLGIETAEMDLHGQRKMNNTITTNIMGDKILSHKEKSAREELARDIVFDRCANRF